MNGFEQLADGVDLLIRRAEERNSVAFAEVGGRRRQGSRVVVTADGVRSATPITDAGFWIRVFAHGGADYRHLPNATPEAVDDVLNRALRACKHTPHDRGEGARIDYAGLHRDVHDGWAASEDGLDVPPERIADELLAAREEVLDGVDADRIRLAYEGGQVTDIMMTTTGSTVRTVRDCASIDCTLAGETQVSNRVAGATGRDVLRDLPAALDAHRERAERQWANPAEAVPDGEHEILLAPEAAGRMFHAVVRYLEADTILANSSPFEIGDRVGPRELSIVDRAGDGAWGSLAYDAACRPTSDVRLIEGGRVRSYLHDAATAAELGGSPSGNYVFATTYEDTPQIATRNLNVSPGKELTDELRAGAGVELERLGEPAFGNEATRTKRASQRPPHALYARRAAAQTPAEFADEPTDQTLRFPVEAGYVLEDGERVGRFEGGEFVVDPTALTDLRLGVERGTVTDAMEKHGSRIPLCATAPMALIRGVIESE